MAGKFDRNFTEEGYLMKYKKGVAVAPYKNWVLQFRVELSGVLPLIWRRILVPSDYNFWDLHVAIQDAMGWQDRHLHHFEIKGKGKRKEEKIGIPDFEQNTGYSVISPGWEIAVMNYFNDLGATARYLYDYGDSWQHSVQLEGYLFRTKACRYPVCVGGERACPPEDCGGEYGYCALLKTLSNPKNEDYEMIKIWVGEDWRPDKFDPCHVVFTKPIDRWKRAFLEP